MPFLLFLRSNIKIISVLALMLACSYGGYKFNDYKRDSELSAAKEAAQEVAKGLMDRESEIARMVENKLSDLRANERVVERERLKIVEKPVYQVNCIDEDGQSLIEKYAKGYKNEE